MSDKRCGDCSHFVPKPYFWCGWEPLPPVPMWFDIKNAFTDRDFPDRHEVYPDTDATTCQAYTVYKPEPKP